MLSEPLAFAYAGWIGGTLLILFYGFISCYTYVDIFFEEFFLRTGSFSAKILARIILDDPRLRSYSDIGLKAFGPRSTLLTGALFCLELFAVRSVAPRSELLPYLTTFRQCTTSNTVCRLLTHCCTCLLSKYIQSLRAYDVRGYTIRICLSS